MASRSFLSLLLLAGVIVGTSGQTYFSESPLLLNELPLGSSSQQGDYIEIDLDFTALPEFTVEFWSANRLFVAQNLAPPQTIFWFGTEIDQDFIWVRGNNGTGGPNFATATIITDVGGDEDFLQVDRVVTSWSHTAITSGPGGFTITFRPKQNQLPTTVASFPVPFNQFPPASRALFGAALPFGKGGTNFLSAKVNEFRVWNTSRTNAQIQENLLSSLTGAEPGLLHYWRFDGDAVDIVGGSTLLSPPSPVFGDVEVPTAFVNTKQLPIRQVFRNIGFAQSIALPFVSDFIHDTLEKQFTVVTAPVYGNLCRRNVTGCHPTEVGRVEPIASGLSVTFEYHPDRDACGTSQNFSIQMYQEASPPATVELSISSFTASFQPFTPVLLGTEGGTLTIPGVWGIDGLLGTTEAVVLTVQPGAVEIECSDARVEGANFICDVAAGVGTEADLTLTVCGQQISLDDVFSFESPNVSVIQGLSFSDVLISGTNLGPSRAINSTSLTDRVLINGTIPCTITQIIHDQINCSVASPLENQQNYIFSILIGGQEISKVVTFAVCSNPCQNGAPCIGSNQCDCTGLPFEGPTCADESAAPELLVAFTAMTALAFVAL